MIKIKSGDLYPVFFDYLKVPNEQVSEGLAHMVEIEYSLFKIKCMRVAHNEKILVVHSQLATCKILWLIFKIYHNSW